MAHFEISDKKVMDEAFIIIDETFNSKKMEAFVMKVLKKYKQYCDDDQAGWYDVKQFVDKEMVKELKKQEEENF